MNIVFLGTPGFVLPIRDELAKHFTLVDSLDQADLGVVAAYGKILTKDELETPKFGCINVHPSLLPKDRGPSPIQQAILNGDKVSGITIIKMDDRVDHGPIIYQESLGLSDIDNFDTLSKKMFQRSAEILPKIIKDFSTGRMKTIPQNHNQATYCDKLTRESGYFAIDHPPSPDKLDKMIRAYYPWPGVWTKWQGKIVKFLPSSSHPERSEGSLTNVSSNELRDSSLVAQNDKFLLQMEGKKPVSKKDFLNGYPNFPFF